jgi:hypothetical protein
MTLKYPHTAGNCAKVCKCCHRENFLLELRMDLPLLPPHPPPAMFWSGRTSGDSQPVHVGSLHSQRRDTRERIVYRSFRAKPIRNWLAVSNDGVHLTNSGLRPSARMQSGGACAPAPHTPTPLHPYTPNRREPKGRIVLLLTTASTNTRTEPRVVQPCLNKMVHT